MSRDPRALVRELYRGLDGFEIPKQDALRVHRSHGSSIYGELMPTATLRLLDQLELKPEDVFADLGAGTGKVVLVAALQTPVGAALGVELSAARMALAREALARAKAKGLPGVDKVELIEADMLRHPLDEVTVAYTCSTAFGGGFMRKLQRRLGQLPKLRRVISLQDFDPDPAFELSEVVRLDASWKRQTSIYIYTRTS